MKKHLGKVNKIFHSLLLAGLLITSASSYTFAEDALTLPQLNQSTGVRTYSFVSDENVTIDSPMGLTGSGTFTVSGKDKSTNSIVFNSLSGFEVSNSGTNLALSNLTLKDAISEKGGMIYYSASDSTVSFNNLSIQNNSVSISDNAYGGARYATKDITLTNTDLVGNYAYTNDSNSDALGGAIYSNANVSLVADSDNVQIVDNYTKVSDNNPEDNAIYMANSASTLTLTSKNNAQMDISDNIDGENGYKVVMTGDSTGRIGAYGNIENAGEVAVSDVDITFADGQVTEHKIDNINIGENVNFVIDADLAAAKADTLTSENGKGTMNVSEMSITSLSDSTGPVTVQVLKDAGDVVLNIDQLQDKLSTTLSTFMYNDSILADSISLGTTSAINDSIVISGAKDVLYEMSSSGATSTSTLIFRTATPYILTKDLATLPQDKVLNIVNNIPSGDRGIIDANGHSMFKLAYSYSRVNLNNIVIKNSSAVNGPIAYVNDISSNFTANNVVFDNNTSTGNGGAVYVSNGTVNISDSNFVNNKSGASGGAIYTSTPNGITVKNTDFKDNIATGKGGAIYADGSVNITAENGGSSTFEGNKSNYTDDDNYTNNAIYVNNSASTLTLNAETNGTINMNDKINGATEKYNLNVTGDDTGNINLNNTVTNAKVSLAGGNLNLAQDNLLQGNDFVGAGSNNSVGTLNLQNNSVGTTNFASFSTTGKMNVAVDVDLANKSMDRITADSYGDFNGTINVNKMNILTEKTESVVRIPFADEAFKNRVSTSLKSVNYKSVVDSRVYRYVVSYDSSDGYFVFGKNGGGGSDSFNPSVLAGVVGQQIGYMNQLINYEYATYHASTYMMLPKKVRGGLYNRHADNVFDTGNLTPTYINLPEEVRSIWIRPYTSFESIPLKNGPKISSINYGTLVGGDSRLIDLGRGFGLVYGGYIGYNGNNYHYKGIHAVQQGGLIGGTVNIYKGNFFNTLTANAGWQINDSDTPYGSDLTHMLIAGFSDKFGYNIELAGGKAIIQPSLAMGYTFVGTFDYKASTGAKINTDPLHVMHFIPGLKIIGNLANGWQPYALINIVCNFNGSSHYTAQDIALPSMSIDPYAEYGIGIQKRWADRYSGFAQATVRSGGRRGFALLFGFRYMLGQLAEKATALLHPDPQRRTAMFKEKQNPNIVVENIRKTDKHKVAKVKPKKQQKTDTKLASTKKKSGNKFKTVMKSIKDKIMYICHKDVSARVVKDVHSDGVLNPKVSGMKNKSGETLLDFKDNDRNSKYGTKPVNQATCFNDYSVTQVDMNLTSSNTPLLKTDSILKRLKQSNKLFYLNQTKYNEPKIPEFYSDYGLEFVNLQF